MLLPKQVLEIMDHVRAHFELAKDAEVTIEANPGTVTMEKLEAWKMGDKSYQHRIAICR